MPGQNDYFDRKLYFVALILRVSRLRPHRTAHLIPMVFATCSTDLGLRVFCPLSATDGGILETGILGRNGVNLLNRS
jgi:hypothetical protein